MATAVALSVCPCRSGERCPQGHHILTVAVADRATETVAVLSCPTLKLTRGDPHKEKYQAERCSGFHDDGYASFLGYSNASRPSNLGVGTGDSFVDRGRSPCCTASLHLISIWPCAETVTCLRDASSAPLSEDLSQVETSLTYGEVGDMGAAFLAGTASGTFKTVSVKIPRCC